MNKTPFRSKYDVVVGGGGVAGIAAAVSASRRGARVALIEKSVLPGGLAVSGLVNIFLPLCDGNGHQVIGGIAEELLKLSIKYGPGTIPPGWNGDGEQKISRYMVKFSSAAFALALDEFLEDNRVDIWYDTVITDTVMDGDRITALKVYNKSGNGVVEADAFVDATGDADIANLAGFEVVDGTNSLSVWAQQASLSSAEAAVKFGDSELLNSMVKLGADDSGKGHPEGEKRWKGVDGRSVSEYAMKSRRFLRDYFSEKISEERELSSFPLGLPSMVQLRTTRRIAGEETILANLANCEIDNSAGRIPSWKKSGVIWSVPVGALVPVGSKNLFAAGRIVSAEEGPAWEAVRSIPAAALTGEIAGKMAADRHIACS